MSAISGSLQKRLGRWVLEVFHHSHASHFENISKFSRYLYNHSNLVLSSGRVIELYRKEGVFPFKNQCLSVLVFGCQVSLDVRFNARFLCNASWAFATLKVYSAELRQATAVEGKRFGKTNCMMVHDAWEVESTES